ncbi:hypothetical protein VTK73DRAFT_8043 [Phialemonium thermophilum]|uniref:4a-hydroxytetrahydrobiopterin dehydratase n=1 Tax=Phialemonium thermophilum TaxID=223376 RepID=A0ABR3WAV5_9PEZI
MLRGPLHLQFTKRPTRFHLAARVQNASHLYIGSVNLFNARVTISDLHRPRAKFSPGSDERALEVALRGLLVPSFNTSSGGTESQPRWNLTAGGDGIERSFKFKTFAKTWDFMTAVSLQCKLKNHHPEWSNVFNNIFIRWTTHSPRGLSAKDLDMATTCDFLARDFGEIHSSAPQCELLSLTNQAASESAGDCCEPKVVTRRGREKQLPNFT